MEIKTWYEGLSAPPESNSSMEEGAELPGADAQVFSKEPSSLSCRGLSEPESYDCDSLTRYPVPECRPVSASEISV